MEIFVVLGVLFLIAIAVNLLAIVVIGAISLFESAIEQGFIGFAVFLASFVFMLPIMLIVSIVVGWPEYREKMSALRE